jgi:hypothetical protein
MQTIGILGLKNRLSEVPRGWERPTIPRYIAGLAVCRSGVLAAACRAALLTGCRLERGTVSATATSATAKTARRRRFIP